MAEKPTQTKTTHWAELDDLDDLLNPSPTSPLAAYKPEPERQQHKRAGDPDLRKASGADTRAATSGINISAQGRDELSRINRNVGADEIDDAEAMRRAGIGHDNARPEPREPGQDLVLARDLTTAAQNTVQVAGIRNPKWHAVRNLPGYLSREIRAMGRGIFGLVSNTPMEDIITIANLHGQGPNTVEEIRAVAGWIRDNAEFVRDLDFDFSQVLPGYEPDVKEYRTDGIRFQIVQDHSGQYIYAYPEQDAKDPESLEVTDLGLPPPPHGQRRRLPQFESASLAEEMRNTLSLLESATHINNTFSPYAGRPYSELKENKVTSLSEEIRKNIYLLESIQEEIDEEAELNELMEELAANEAYRGKASKARYMDPEAQKARMSRHSTLGPLLSKEPGGPMLIKWLHKKMGLGAQADWSTEKSQEYTSQHGGEENDSVVTGKWGSGIWNDNIKDARVMWTIIKNHPDNFIVFSGENGVGAVRPKIGYIEDQRRKDPAYNPAKDNTLPYTFAFFTNEGSATPTDQTALALLSGPGILNKKGQYSKRGGRPFVPDKNANLLDAVKAQIGKIKRADAAFPAPAGQEGGQSVERGKIAQRAASRASAPENRSTEELTSAIWKKISPVVSKIANKTVLKINNRAKRLIDAGNFEGATKISQAGEKLRQFLIAIDNSADPGLIPQQYAQTFNNVLKVACREFGGNFNDKEDYRQFLASALTVGEELKFILDTFRTQLGGGDVNPYAE